jgi:hypothetical protein
MTQSHVGDVMTSAVVSTGPATSYRQLARLLTIVVTVLSGRTFGAGVMTPIPARRPVPFHPAWSANPARVRVGRPDRSWRRSRHGFGRAGPFRHSLCWQRVE